jgi:transcriptional regulator of aromatic amino acid metabolism
LVELLRRSSNRPDLLNPLVNALKKIKNDTPDTEPDLASVRGNEPSVWRVTDRLSPSDVDTLIKSYQAGSTGRLLAERYNISTATVKRLLREHGVRKQRPRAVT